ncbi:GTPase HflX [Halorussus marinus]|uniref:GTPase HflX n=1 Tax=Halorussus marinus TaxID=2505976 RepID=UPI00106ECF73|nr:GTPase HflX [Halorussus marinus]
MQSRDAVVAKRADAGTIDTDEIRGLARSAGYAVVAELTQRRGSDSTYEFGRGKAERLAETVAATGADTVVFDNELTPTQTVELAALCPEGTRVLDRHRLVLDIFEARAGDRRSTLQVERAKLAWRLPRIRERSDEQAMNRRTESGTRYYDVLDRLDELTRKIEALGDEAAARRDRRREEGFEYVALAGYTNAGKSTLFHRLADDLDFSARDPDHADLDATAEIEDRLFETLDTTTRRATIDGRPTLVTDTVGFVEGLSHELVESFHGTLSVTASAECVAVVADAGDPPARLRTKLATTCDRLADADGELVAVLNKADLLDPDELAARREAVAEVAAASDAPLPADPVAVSAIEGQNLDALGARISEALSERRSVEIAAPSGDDAMRLVSWLYERASVDDVDYRGDEVRIAFTAPASIAATAESRAAALDADR